jgi:hypothetical protein
MRQWLHSTDTKVAIHPTTGEVVTGFCQHTDIIGTGRKYDSWVRAIVFPSRKRVYFRFYKPDGDYYFIDDADRAHSFDVCFTAWQALIKQGYCRKSWKPLFAVTDRIVTEGDIKL